MRPLDPRPRPVPLGVAGSLAALVAVVVLVLLGLVPGSWAGSGGGPDARATAEGPSAAGPATGAGGGPRPAASASPGPAPEGAGAVPVAPATPPSAADDAGGAPVRVSVPDRGIDVPVDPVGVAGDGQMEIPPLAERAGWYRFGADPADPAGTTVVAAHVDSVASGGTGPFVRLVDVQVGDRVQVALADGTTRTYAVDQVARFPKSQARWPDVFTRDGPPRLALVTCGGAFDRDTRHYTDNVLVTAAPVAA